MRFKRCCIGPSELRFRARAEWIDYMRRARKGGAHVCDVTVQAAAKARERVHTVKG
jgi:hypothetical protein